VSRTDDPFGTRTAQVWTGFCASVGIATAGSGPLRPLGGVRTVARACSRPVTAVDGAAVLVAVWATSPRSPSRRAGNAQRPARRA